MPPLPMRPLVNNCTTTADSLSKGKFPGAFGRGALPVCLGVFRAWVCFAWMPGPPSPAARTPPQRT